MESLEDIISPRDLHSAGFRFRTSKSFSYENGRDGRHDITKMEYMVFDGHGQSSSKPKQRRRNNHEMPCKFWDIQDNFPETESLDFYYNNDNGEINDESFEDLTPFLEQTPTTRNPVDGEQHIAHRKCKKRICEFCQPKAEKSRHDPKEPVEPVLFFRWEKAYDSSRTPPTYLRKVKYTVNGLGQVSKVVDKKVKGKIRESTEAINSKIRVKLDTLKGHRVIARLDEDGLYYPAVVVKCPDPRHAIVSYDSGSNAEILTRNLILTGGAVARPHLKAGDYVMMRVVNLDTNDECYVPAIIQIEPQKVEAQAKFYSVLMYNGQKASTLRTFLVKISKERFELASMYIAHQQNEDRKKANEIIHVTPRRKENKKPKIDDLEINIAQQVAVVRNSTPGVIESLISIGKDSHRSVTESLPSVPPTDGRVKELERLLLEIKEREEKQDYQMGKLKRKIKILSRREKRKSSEKQMQIITIPETPSLDPSADEIEELKQVSDQLSDQVIEPESDEEHQSLTLMQLRKSLSPLRPGQEVLARWSDDGWYYRGIVKHNHSDYSYNLEDSTGLIERIWRENIFTENRGFDNGLQRECAVIALHPEYNFSYAPAMVEEVNEDTIEVKFYDNKTFTLSRKDIEFYLSSLEKHHIDVDYIQKQESRLIGAAVIARDDRTGAFYPGSVIGRADNGVDYVVGWTDGTEVEQKSIYIFSAFTRRPPLSAGDRVLALSDSVLVKFLPGYLMGTVDGLLIVKFCDGEISEAVDPASCYWLGKTYYDEAIKYYKAHEPSFY